MEENKAPAPERETVLANCINGVSGCQHYFIHFHTENPNTVHSDNRVTAAFVFVKAQLAAANERLSDTEKQGRYLAERVLVLTAQLLAADEALDALSVKAGTTVYELNKAVSALHEGIEKAEKQRDAANERAEKAERERDRLTRLVSCPPVVTRELARARKGREAAEERAHTADGERYEVIRQRDDAEERLAAAHKALDESARAFVALSSGREGVDAALRVMREALRKHNVALRDAYAVLAFHDEHHDVRERIHDVLFKAALAGPGKP